MNPNLKQNLTSFNSIERESELREFDRETLDIVSEKDVDNINFDTSSEYISSDFVCLEFTTFL